MELSINDFSFLLQQDECIPFSICTSLLLHPIATYSYFKALHFIVVCPSFKSHAKLHLLIAVLSCCPVSKLSYCMTTLLPRVFLSQEVSNNDILQPFFPSLAFCCQTVTNKMWHLRKIYKCRKKRSSKDKKEIPLQEEYS